MQPVYDAFFRHLSQIDTLPSAPEDAERLRQALAELRLSPLSAGAESRSVLLPELRGSTRFSSLRIGADSVELTIDGVPHRLPYLTDGWAPARFPGSEEACLVSGAWTRPDRFELCCELCGDFSCTLKLFVQLDGAVASVRTVASLGEFQAGWNGDAWGHVAN